MLQAAYVGMVSLLETFTCKGCYLPNTCELAALSCPRCELVWTAILEALGDGDTLGNPGGGVAFACSSVALARTAARSF